MNRRIFSIITLFIILSNTTLIQGIDAGSVGVSVGDRFKYYVHDLYVEGEDPSVSLPNMQEVKVQKNDIFELELETVPEDGSYLGSVTAYINNEEINFISINFVGMFEFFIFTDWEYWTINYNFENQLAFNQNITNTFVAVMYDTYFYASSELKSTNDDSLYTNSTVYYGLDGAIKVYSVIMKEFTNTIYSLNISDDETNSEFIIENSSDNIDPELDISNSIDNTIFSYLFITSIVIVFIRKKNINLIERGTTTETE